MLTKKIALMISSAFIISTISANLSYAQTIDSNKTSSTINSNKNYSEQDISLLNSLLEKQDYYSFYDKFKTINVSPKAQIDYLNEKKYLGHTPLYWLMAEYYAQNKNAFETHKWLYIATIMTQQDAALCNDSTAKFASQKLLRTFPNTLDVTRKTPQYISSAMSEVKFFIDNLKTRTNPIWACSLGTEPIDRDKNVLMPREAWPSVRASVLKNFMSQYSN